MSAARSSGELPSRREAMPAPPADIAHLRSRRRDAVRRRRLARVDLGLGLAGALLLWILTPGLAIAALIAGVVLVACAMSFGVQRRRRRRARLEDPGRLEREGSAGR